MTKRSLSYDELMTGKVDRAEIERLAWAGMLDAATGARLGHIGRFMERVANAMPNPKLKVGDVFTDEELQTFWRERAPSIPR